MNNIISVNIPIRRNLLSMSDHERARYKDRIIKMDAASNITNIVRDIENMAAGRHMLREDDPRRR